MVLNLSYNFDIVGSREGITFSLTEQQKIMIELEEKP